jgi:vancomycin permeability regulator SanA
MKQKFLKYFKQTKQLVIKRRKWVIAAVGVAILVPVSLMVAAYLVINPYGKYVLGENDSQSARVGLVLGAGVTKDGKIYKELQGRLDVAARELEAGRVDILLLSGDNRFKDYDEPTAMINYLVREKGVTKDKLQADFAGRSTFESCNRAAYVFNLKKVVIISGESHLPRAIYLCRHMGIEAYGVPSFVEANNSSRREAQARVKALLNVHVLGEPTVGGSQIDLNR